MSARLTKKFACILFSEKGRLVMALKPRKLLGLKYSIFQDIIKGNEELYVDIFINTAIPRFGLG